MDADGTEHQKSEGYTTLKEAEKRKKENLNPDIHEQKEEENRITIPEGVDPELLMKVLGNPEMAALLTSLAKTMKV